MKIFKNPLFKTTKPISNKFAKKHPWVDGSQIFTNKNSHPSRGDNSKIIKIYGEYLNMFYFRTTGPVSFDIIYFNRKFICNLKVCYMYSVVSCHFLSHYFSNTQV